MVTVAHAYYNFTTSPITYAASPLAWTQITLVDATNANLSPNSLPSMVNAVRVNNSCGSAIAIGVGASGSQQIVGISSGAENEELPLLLSKGQNIWIAPYDVTADSGVIVFNFLKGKHG